MATGQCGTIFTSWLLPKTWNVPKGCTTPLTGPVVITLQWGGFEVSSANEGKLEIDDKIILQFGMDSKRSNWLFSELIFG